MTNDDWQKACDAVLALKAAGVPAKVLDPICTYLLDRSPLREVMRRLDWRRRPFLRG